MEHVSIVQILMKMKKTLVINRNKRRHILPVEISKIINEERELGEIDIYMQVIESRRGKRTTANNLPNRPV